MVLMLLTLLFSGVCLAAPALDAVDAVDAVAVWYRGTSLMIKHPPP